MRAMAMNRTIRWVALAAGALALAWWLWPRSAPRAAGASAASTSPASAGGGASASDAPTARHVPVAAQPPPSRVVIDEVTLDRTEACEGEEILVSVFAHAEDPADDDHLHAVIDGVPGMSVPLVARRRSPDSPPPQVIVFGRGETRVTADVPPFTVRDCPAPRTLAIAYRLALNTNAEFEFEARIDAGAAAPFVAVEYEWDFGDGTSVTTTEPRAVHDYGQRPQVSVYSNQIVQVTARAAGGDAVIGRKTILFHNPQYANLEFAGVVTLVVELTPRFPTITDGQVVQGVRLWHHRPDPVRITRVRARRNSSVPGSEPVVTEVPVESVLGTTSIPPSGLDVRLTLDVAADPEVFSIDYLLDGVSAEGYPVESIFSVMKPPTPTVDAHVRVEDPAMVERILLAQQLLGKDLVTEDELLALQRQGAFEGFKPVADDPEPKLPPVYQP